MFWLKTELWTAEVVYAGFGTPMLRGALAVQGGHVVGVGSLEALQARFPGAPVVAKGKALLPPPVNAHTHLDLSLLPLYQGPFAGFLPHVVAHREKRGLLGARRGLEELLTSGVGAFADIVFKDEVMDFLLLESPLPGVAFYEVFAPDPKEAEEVFARVKAKVEGWRRREGRVKVGLSPHAPYSVSPSLLKRLAQYAQAEGIPLMVHVAESPEEVAFLREGKGPLAEVYRRFSPTPFTPPGLTPVRHLHALGVLGPHTLLVHGVQVDEEEVALLAETGTKVVLCPRSNQNLEVGEAPIPLYARYGVELALGTDSRASSPDLDVRQEALFLWGKVDPRLLVRALTRGGYRALGLATPRITRGTPVSLVHSL
ncbi:MULTISPECIES: amidohydrolase family protein [Thermus]|jgi:cytosine/adenosine deaminase-related metal-dependent hydrolase|uniref:Amidohydrolase n=1 Tax=Thermus brockianus TaxID=56956 RepID=A0A1J0LVN6_THEBO|nr:amidohydrolase family protein [Thermus brockianus]APD10264.1 amidohydrolase [Thermus brockianus]BDG16454.1 amidohydrolase [Thermus brockianus]